MRSLCLAFLPVLCIGAQSKGWHYVKDDPATKIHICDISAGSFETADNGHTMHLHDVTARIYDSTGNMKGTIKSKEAVASFESQTLRYGPDLKSILSLRD